MNLAKFCRELTGIPGVDTWTCYQFDSAVRAFGSWVENKLNDPDDKRGAQRILDACLDDHEAAGDTFSRMVAFFGLKAFDQSAGQGIPPAAGSNETSSKRPPDELIQRVRNRGK